MDTSNQNQAVVFNYIKGSDFRSVHVDGAIGGLTTKGFLHIALFTERGPIPKKTIHEILPDGTLGKEVVEKRESKEGIVRLMEVDLFMNEDTARDLRNWLDQELESFEDRRRKLEKLKKRDELR
ncbi:MAG: hypothetical protein LJE91_06665 [Gammaproteobacteria bacterium]|nr:hypothetical protein [Gammaproteobacteria bacterium]